MKTKYKEIIICCDALEERVKCNGWKGILKWKSIHMLVGDNIYSYCPFCGERITEDRSI